MIDFQNDICQIGGSGSALGNNVRTLWPCLPPAVKLLAKARSIGIPVIHTNKSHKQNLSDLAIPKLLRGNLPRE